MLVTKSCELCGTCFWLICSRHVFFWSSDWVIEWFTWHPHRISSQTALRSRLCQYKTHPAVVCCKSYGRKPRLIDIKDCFDREKGNTCMSLLSEVELVLVVAVRSQAGVSGWTEHSPGARLQAGKQIVLSVRNLTWPCLGYTLQLTVVNLQFVSIECLFVFSLFAIVKSESVSLLDCIRLCTFCALFFECWTVTVAATLWSICCFNVPLFSCHFIFSLQRWCCSS